MKKINVLKITYLQLIIILLFGVITTPVSAVGQGTNFLSTDITSETTILIEWRINYGKDSTYLPFARQILQENIADVEKGIEQLFLQDVQNIQIVEDNETLVITFKLVGNYSDSFVTGKYRDLYELGEYAPVGVDVLKIKIPDDKYFSSIDPGANEIVEDKKNGGRQ